MFVTDTIKIVLTSSSVCMYDNLRRKEISNHSSLLKKQKTKTSEEALHHGCNNASESKHFITVMVGGGG